MVTDQLRRRHEFHAPFSVALNCSACLRFRELILICLTLPIYFCSFLVFPPLERAQA